MSDTEAGRQAENVTPPTASATVGVGVTALATSTSSATVDLDPVTNPGLYGRYIDIQADGAKIYILFDDDSTGNIDETDNGSTAATGTAETVPWPIPDGVTISVRLNPTKHRYLHTKAASGTPTLRIRPSSQKGLKDDRAV